MYYFNRFFNIFINKICGILLVVVLILLAFFLGLYKADAAVSATWYEYVKLPSIAHAANCNDTTCYVSGIDTLTGYGNGISSRNFYYVSSIYTKQNGNGMMWVYNVDTSFKKGYLYSIRTYMCNNSTTNYVHVSFTTGNNVANTHNKTTVPTYWQSVATNVIDDFIGFDTIGEGKCGFVTHFFVPSVDSQYVGVQFTSTESVTGSQALYGYEYDSLGLYTPELRNQIDSAIQESNLATAEDIDKLNEEVKQMTSEQKQTNEKLDDLNDNITSNDTTNSDSEGSGFFNDFATSDNGGISGIITAPLTLINGMVEGNNKCDNLEFNLSFLGKNKEVYLPSGCIMWDKAPDSAVALYQTLLCGVFGYILMVNLFKEIQDLKNPKDEEVDTLDL